MAKVEIRYQRVSDAKRFLEILQSLKTPFFPCPKDIKEEREILEKHIKLRKEKKQFYFGILYDKKLVGGMGIKIDNVHNQSVEIGYFIDKSYQGKGIAPKATKLIEKYAFNTLKKSRIEIRTNVKNRPSQKVAVKLGYKREGKFNTGKKERGKYIYDYVYAKIK